MYLSKHKSGYYYIYFTTQDGKRKKVSTRTKIKKEANEFVRNFKEEFYSKSHNDQKIPLKDFIWKYLRYSEINHTWKTTLTYRTTFNFLQKFLGNKILNDISDLDINNFIQYRISSVSTHAGRKDLINLKASFSWAIKMNLMTSNPALNVKRIRMPEIQPLYFSREDYKTLLDKVDNPQLRDIIIVAVNTGMRQMEILTLLWNQVDLTTKQIILHNHHHITKGKRIRTIPLNNSSQIVFSRLYENRNCEFVFHHNGSKIKQDYVIKNFKKYIRKTDLNQKLHFHSLRHTYCSWLVQSGVSLYQVCKLAGFSDSKMVNVYGHLRADDLKESVNLLDKYSD